MTKDISRQFINVAVFIGTLIVNFLSTSLPLNGMDPGQISDMFPVYFVPAPYVFSIWGLIYLLLLGFIVYQALPSQRENPRLRKIGYWFALNGIANSLWLVLWHYLRISLSLLVMFFILWTLVKIYTGLNIGRSMTSGWERWLVDMPFRVYLGWISVATIANFSSLLYYLEWAGWGLSPEVWMAVILVVAVALAALMIFQRKDAVFLFVLAWALIGIAVKHGDNPFIYTITWISAAAVLLLVAYALFKNKVI